MRVEPDRQGHHSSEAPACHRCGVPLLADTTFCPYCERWLDEPGPVRRRDTAGRSGGRLAVVTERALLTVGFVFFAAVAIICVVAALLI
jgi:hypothetical protein